MTEDRQALLATLDELHDELEAADDVSPAVEAKLREAIVDIRRVLDANDEEAEETPPTVVGGLTEAAQDFESSHPTLSSMVGSVIDALARMGI